MNKPGPIAAAVGAVVIMLALFVPLSGSANGAIVPGMLVNGSYCTPTLNFNPSSGPAGSQFTASGNCYTTSSVPIKWNVGITVGTQIATCTPQTGAFSCSITVPAGPTGEYDVSACCSSGVLIENIFTVTYGSVTTTTTTTYVAPSTTTTSTSFTPPPGQVTSAFYEAGLPQGTVWSMSYNGAPGSASAPQAIAFTTVPGSFTYTVQAVPGYTESPSSGTLQAGGSQTIYFSPMQTTTTISTTPPLTASGSVSPTSGPAPLTVSYTISPSGGVPPYAETWTFGDSFFSYTASGTHIFQSQGTYSMSVQITDSAGSTASYGTTITVSCPAGQVPGPQGQGCATMQTTTSTTTSSQTGSATATTSAPLTTSTSSTSLCIYGTSTPWTQGMGVASWPCPTTTTSTSSAATTSGGTAYFGSLPSSPANVYALVLGIVVAGGGSFKAVYDRKEEGHW